MAGQAYVFIGRRKTGKRARDSKRGKERGGGS